MTSKGFEPLEVGLTEKGDPFYIPRFNTLIAGSTGVGKTEAVRKIVSAVRRLIPDLHVLIFDVKATRRDWEGYGTDVPIYVETATDSRFLRDLIETQEGRKIDWFFYELHLACENAEIWDDVLANLRERYAKYKDRNQMKEEKLGTLIIYMEALTEELRKGEYTTKFDLSNPISVVPINFRGDAFQQLVVYSYLQAMKKHRVKRVLVVIDEMSNLAPSKRGTGCRRIIEQYLYKQGRAAEVFGLAIDQEIVGISTAVRRQCWNWILGMQTETGAQKRTISQIPGGKKLAIDDIATLGVGWWWAVIRKPGSTEIEKFYLVPEGISVEIGRQVINGEMEVEEMMELISKRDADVRKVEPVDQLVAGVQLGTISGKVEALEKRISGLGELVANHLRAAELRREDWDKKFIHGEERYGFLEKKIEDLYSKISGLPSELNVSTDAKLVEQKKLVHTEVAEITVDFSTVDLDGKVMHIAKGGFLDEWKTEPEIEKELLDRAWSAPTSSLYRVLDRLSEKGFLVKKRGKPIKFKLAGDVVFLRED